MSQDVKASLVGKANDQITLFQLVSYITILKQVYVIVLDAFHLLVLEKYTNKLLNNCINMLTNTTCLFRLQPLWTQMG